MGNQLHIWEIRVVRRPLAFIFFRGKHRGKQLRRRRLMDIILMDEHRIFYERTWEVLVFQFFLSSVFFSRGGCIRKEGNE